MRIADALIFQMPVQEKKGVKNDIDLNVDDMKELVARFKAYYREQKGEDFLEEKYSYDETLRRKHK